MAHTKTDYVLTAGFTGADVLAKLGEVFAGLGYMANATAWYDSFTDTQGSEVRILQMVYTGSTGTYNTVYHSFMNKATYDGLWYTVYYAWNTTTHESDGTTNYDHVSSYEHPDDLSLNSWNSYYVKLANPSNASDYTISTYEGAAGETPLIRFHNSGESRLFHFVPTDSTAIVVDDFSSYGPPPMMTMLVNSNDFSLAPLMFTNRSSMGYADTSTSSNDWNLSVGYGSHLEGGGITTLGLADFYDTHTRVGKVTLSRRSGTERSPFYCVAKNHRAAGMAYDATFGDNFALIAGYTGGSFTPSTGDFLVVSAGVEEYEVIQLDVSSDLYAEWYVIASRSV